MNHTINLLEPSEIRYLSAAESNPLYRYAAVGVLALALAGSGVYYFNLRREADEARSRVTRWEEIRDQVAEAEELMRRNTRLERGENTLRGWSDSRVDWSPMLTYILEQIPGPPEDIQFTRLLVEETMEGLRNQAPAKEAPARPEPLRRVVELNLLGVIRSDRPERMLTRFQRNLLNGARPPAAIDAVLLNNYIQLRDEDGNITDLTNFSFTLRLAPLPLVPVEPNR